MNSTQLTDEPEYGVYRRIMTMMSSSGTPFRLIHHRPEGRTAEASEIRGHSLRQAAKCIVVRTRTAGGLPRHSVVVVPGDRRVDLEAVTHHVGGDRTTFADRPTAERLTQCRSGSIVPFTFHRDLELLADPTLLEPEEIFFNAARLDRSLAVAPADWAALACPLIRPVAQRDPVAVG
ncbi:YbaK/EbsC family protein [Kitasatospora aureofaciens]|uniref:YbaK/EbsC family protein n=1 Tax=Kitasatospora aureofaciens TaxID=1894 RepID=UPI0027DF16DB|nr:YbaK/EbsC family protein [Kitasatospora aureofaciens]